MLLCRIGLNKRLLQYTAYYLPLLGQNKAEVKKFSKNQSQSICLFHFRLQLALGLRHQLIAVHAPLLRVIQRDSYNHRNFKVPNLKMSTNVKCETTEVTTTTTTTVKDANVSEVEVEAKPTTVSSEPASKQMSKRAMKRKARAEQFKIRKRRKAENQPQTKREDAGYSMDVFDKTAYYFEHGLRKVYPYHFAFTTYAKGRWVGRKLKNVLEMEFGFEEPEDVDKAFEQGKIHVNDIQVSADYVVKDNDHISHEIHRHENPVSDSPLEIIADTDDVVVINKPTSIPCHPCGRYRFNSVVFILGKESGYTNLRNIYRLDRLTSGVLVLGKTPEMTKKLEDQVVNRQVYKEYVCRVMGEFPSETLTVDQPIQALSNKLRLQVVSPKGKSSQTTFTRLSYNGRSSVVKCVPRTGRTHQIRVHLQYLGHPIINDAFYNSDAWGPNKGKGGVYEVAKDIVCASIIERHKATQWEGGENPLYFKKLEELQQQQEEQQKQQKSTETVQDHSQAVLETPSQEKNSLTLIKKVDIDSKDITDSVQEQTLTSSCKEISPGAENNFATEAESRIGFDWTKWQVEASCDLCRKTTLEPKPRDLVMFLHAWKYKGPDWEYQTKLPDWAHEDWKDEDLYMLELEQTTNQTLPDSERTKINSDC